LIVAGLQAGGLLVLFPFSPVSFPDSTASPAKIFYPLLLPASLHHQLNRNYSPVKIHFKMQPVTQLDIYNSFSINRNFLKSHVEAGCGVEINYHKEGFLGFTFEEETVLAVIYAN
jgi:hypothetical protein